MELKAPRRQILGDILNHMDRIIAEIENKSMKGVKLHEVERHLFSSLLALGLQLLGYYVLLLVGQKVRSSKQASQ